MANYVSNKRMLLVTFQHNANENQIQNLFNRFNIRATNVGKVIKRYTFDIKIIRSIYLIFIYELSSIGKANNEARQVFGFSDYLSQFFDRHF